MSEAPNEATTDEDEPPGKEIEYASKAPDEALTDEGEPSEKEMDVPFVAEPNAKKKRRPGRPTFSISALNIRRRANRAALAAAGTTETSHPRKQVRKIYVATAAARRNQGSPSCC